MFIDLHKKSGHLLKVSIGKVSALQELEDGTVLFIGNVGHEVRETLDDIEELTKLS